MSVVVDPVTVDQNRAAGRPVVFLAGSIDEGRATAFYAAYPDIVVE